MTHRRTVLGFGLAAGALLAAGPSWAAWPDKPIRLVVPYAAGGSADGMGRLIAQHLGELMGVPVIVDNKPGGSTQVGAEYVAKARPDGYTLLLGTSSTGMLMLRKQGSPVDIRKDLDPIMAFAESVFVILAGPAAPFKTMPELIAYAKANPGKVTYSVPGTGTTSHLVGEYLNSVAGMKMLVVPYKGGGPASVGLLGGEVMVSIDGIGPTNPFIKEGKVTLLATTGTERSKIFPTSPIVSETLPGFVANGWIGLVSSPGTPPDVLDKLHTAMATIVAKPEVRERITSLSLNPVSTTGAEYRRLTVAEVDKWGKVVRESGLVIE